MAPILQPSHPLTRASLDAIRRVLSMSPQALTTLDRKGKQAAVVIPLCNVKGSSGVLFEVRGRRLRSHSGEVSFPGGKVEDDETIWDAALRETQEELGIDPKRMEFLGGIGPPELSLRQDLLVWPSVAFLHANTKWSECQAANDVLPSIDLASLQPSVDNVEVDRVFHVPFTAFTSPARVRASLFRGQRPYWAVSVTDLAFDLPHKALLQLSPSQIDDHEVGSGINGQTEIWGLTGWFLSLFLRTMLLYPSDNTTTSS